MGSLINVDKKQLNEELKKVKVEYNFNEGRKTFEIVVMRQGHPIGMLYRRDTSWMSYGHDGEYHNLLDGVIGLVSHYILVTEQVNKVNAQLLEE